MEASRYQDPDLKWMERYRWPRGVSLTWNGTTYREIRTVPESVWRYQKEGDEFFVGGRIYEGIPQEVADRLIASGYGDRLEEE